MCRIFNDFEAHFGAEIDPKSVLESMGKRNHIFMYFKGLPGGRSEPQAESTEGSSRLFLGAGGGIKGGASLQTVSVMGSTGSELRTEI